eukprot:m.143845 g.143845  ORF g.143845 m.143845 type:complete len:753 (+) comp16178_c0_seq3:44-2302(+)
MASAPIYQTLCAHVAAKGTELGFKKGAKLMLVQKFGEDSGWWQMCTAKAKTGYVQSSKLTPTPVSKAKLPKGVQFLPPRPDPDQPSSTRLPVDERTKAATWYLGKITKDESKICARQLLQHGVNGDFILRMSDSTANAYALTVKADKLRNYKIECSSRLFKLGDVSDSTMYGLLEKLTKDEELPILAPLRLDYTFDKRAARAILVKVTDGSVEPSDGLLDVEEEDSARRGSVRRRQKRERARASAPFEEDAAAKAAAKAEADAAAEAEAAAIEAARREVTETGGVAKAKPPPDTGYLTSVEVEALQRAKDTGYFSLAAMSALACKDGGYLTLTEIKSATAQYLTIEDMQAIVAGEEVCLDRGALRNISKAIKSDSRAKLDERLGKRPAVHVYEQLTPRAEQDNDDNNDNTGKSPNKGHSLETPGDNDVNTASPFMTPATSIANTPATKGMAPSNNSNSTTTTTPLAQVTSASTPDLRRLSGDSSAPRHSQPDLSNVVDDLEDPLRPSPDSDDDGHSKSHRGSRLKRLFKRSPHGSRDSIHQRSPSSEVEAGSSTKSANSSPKLSRRLRKRFSGHRRAKSDVSTDTSSLDRSSMQQLLSPAALKQAAHPTTEPVSTPAGVFQAMNTGEQRTSADDGVQQRLEESAIDKPVESTPNIEVTEALVPSSPGTANSTKSEGNAEDDEASIWARAKYPTGAFPPLPALGQIDNTVAVQGLTVALTSHHLARLGRFADDYQEALPSADLNVAWTSTFAL